LGFGLALEGAIVEQLEVANIMLLRIDLLTSRFCKFQAIQHFLPLDPTCLRGRPLPHDHAGGILLPPGARARAVRPRSFHVGFSMPTHQGQTQRTTAPSVSWDGSLGRPARDGALDAIVNRYEGLVLSIAKRFTSGDIHDAQDITQEVFLKLWQSTATIAKVRSWLSKITSNLGIDYRRKKASSCTHPSEDMSVHKAPQECTLAELLRTLKEWMDEAKLGDRSRRFAACYALSGMDYGEIARQFGVTQNAVELDISRTRHKLREMLSPGVATQALHSERPRKKKGTSPVGPSGPANPVALEALAAPVETMASVDPVKSHCPGSSTVQAESFQTESSSSSTAENTDVDPSALEPEAADPISEGGSR